MSVKISDWHLPKPSHLLLVFCAGHVLSPCQWHPGAWSPQVHQLCDGQSHGSENHRLWLQHLSQPRQRLKLQSLLSPECFVHSFIWSLSYIFIPPPPLRLVDCSGASEARGHLSERGRLQLCHHCSRDCSQKEHLLHQEMLWQSRWSKLTQPLSNIKLPHWLWACPN